MNVNGSVIFAGMSESAVTDAAGLGSIEIKAIPDEGYPLDFAVAVIAASATIAPIILPSVPLLIYGMLADVSIGRLFLGDFISGLLIAAALMCQIRWMAQKQGVGAVPGAPRRRPRPHHGVSGGGPVAPLVGAGIATR